MSFRYLAPLSTSSCPTTRWQATVSTSIQDSSTQGGNSLAYFLLHRGTVVVVDADQTQMMPISCLRAKHWRPLDRFTAPVLYASLPSYPVQCSTSTHRFCEHSRGPRDRAAQDDTQSDRRREIPAVNCCSLVDDDWLTTAIGRHSPRYHF